jgi:hypothetical protein
MRTVMSTLGPAELKDPEDLPKFYTERLPKSNFWNTFDIELIELVEIFTINHISSYNNYITKS